MAAAMLFTVRDAGDISAAESEHASLLTADPAHHDHRDRRSRYRSTLAANTHLFHDPDGHAPSRDRAQSPLDCEQPVALTCLILGLPLPLELLPDPAYDDSGIADVPTARRAVRALAHHASVITGELLGDPDGDRPRWRPGGDLDD